MRKPTKREEKLKQLEEERKAHNERVYQAVVASLSQEGQAAYKYFLQNIEEFAPRIYEWPEGSRYCTSRSAENQMKILFELAKKGLENDRWARRVKELEHRLKTIRNTAEGKIEFLEITKKTATSDVPESETVNWEKMPEGVIQTNGGITCDMWTGPCACGAWHKDGK
jgi:hypothetical protein